VDLPLLEESSERNAEPLCEQRAILANRTDGIAEVKAEIERAVRITAHTTLARREDVSKAMPIQKGGMERAHDVGSSTPSLHTVIPQAKSRVFQVRAGSWVCIDFLPSNGPRRCKSR
jgi:hypothetical protein